MSRLCFAPRRTRLSATVAAFTLGLVCSVVAPLGADLKPESRIVPQPNAPVKIVNYAARYIDGTTSSVRSGIQHRVGYSNPSGKIVTALQLGLVAFDIWNEFLDRTNGLDRDGLAVGKDGSGTWLASASADFSFLTGVAYVRRVRFDDGTIWEADEVEILDAMRKIQKDFDASRLKEVAPPPKPQ